MHMSYLEKKEQNKGKRYVWLGEIEWYGETLDSKESGEEALVISHIFISIEIQGMEYR